MDNFIETKHGIFWASELNGKTAQQVYEDWLEYKEKTPQKNEIELLKEQLQTQQELIDTLMFDILPTILLKEDI